jgi:hypothetical protein
MFDPSIRLQPARPLSLLALAVTLAGCSESDPAGPQEEPFGSLTVDAVADWAFVDLAATATPVQVADRSTSGAWDIAFFATTVMLNGGAAGPGEVEGYCLCQNDGASDEDIIAMTPNSEAADFEAVTELQIPADGWETDVLDPAIEGWWSYNPTTHVVSAAPEKTWKVRTAEGTAFAKLHVTAIEDAAMAHAGKVTLEFATQTAAGEPFGDTKTLTVDLAAGPVYVDLLDAAISDASSWDIRLEGYDVRVNSGISGDGEAAAIDAGEPFADITDAGDVVESVYKSDAFGGAFKAHPWYRYDLQGNHQIWPTFDVYLIRTGVEIYKVQLTSYYESSTGDGRHITFRYAQLAD